MEVAHVAASIYLVGEESVLVLGWEIASPAAAEFAIFLVIANGYKDSIDSLKRNQYLEGVSEGIVTGANRANPKFVRYAFGAPNPIACPYFPKEEKNLQGWHNRGLVEGYKYGKQLNGPEREKLFNTLNSKMRTLLQHDFRGDYSSNWDLNKKRYYEDAAITFKSIFLQR